VRTVDGRVQTDAIAHGDFDSPHQLNGSGRFGLFIVGKNGAGKNTGEKNAGEENSRADQNRYNSGTAAQDVHKVLHGRASVKENALCAKSWAPRKERRPISAAYS
jgi:hypothetical protein